METVGLDSTFTLAAAGYISMPPAAPYRSISGPMGAHRASFMES